MHSAGSHRNQYFSFLCCCFKSKARMVIWNKKTPTCSDSGRGKKGIPSFSVAQHLVKKVHWWCHQGNAGRFPDICQYDAHCHGLPLLSKRGKTLLLEPACASKADVQNHTLFLSSTMKTVKHIRCTQSQIWASSLSSLQERSATLKGNLMNCEGRTGRLGL